MKSSGLREKQKLEKMIAVTRLWCDVSFSNESQAAVFGSIFQFFELNGMGFSCERENWPHAFPFLHCSWEDAGRFFACLTNQRKRSAPDFAGSQSVSWTDLLSPAVGSA
jgi:hypothetical protein